MVLLMTIVSLMTMASSVTLAIALATSVTLVDRLGTVGGKPHYRSADISDRNKPNMPATPEFSV